MKNLLLLVVLLAATLCGYSQKQKLYIADRKLDCLESVNDGCLQVKESKKGAWHNFTGKIEGFNYQEGFDYKLVVEPIPVAAGQPVSYRLVKIASQKKTNYNPAERISGKKWYLLTMFADTHYLKLLDTTTIYIEVDVAGKSLSGHGVCNNIKGGVDATAGNISFLQISLTKMACPGNIMEKIVVDMLEEMKSYKLAGNMLTLAGPDNSFMIFRQGTGHN